MAPGSFSKLTPVHNRLQQERERLIVLEVPSNDQGSIPPLFATEWNVSLMKILVELKKHVHDQRLRLEKRAKNANATLVAVLIVDISVNCFFSLRGNKERSKWFYALFTTFIIAVSLLFILAFSALKNAEGRLKALKKRDADLISLTEKFKKVDGYGAMDTVTELVTQMEIMYAVMMPPLFPDDIQPRGLWPAYLFCAFGYFSSLLSLIGGVSGTLISNNIPNLKELKYSNSIWICEYNPSVSALMDDLWRRRYEHPMKELYSFDKPGRI